MKKIKTEERKKEIFYIYKRKIFKNEGKKAKEQKKGKERKTFAIKIKKSKI